jgi:drug/metabolite transporter (DMT)-like permease
MTVGSAPISPGVWSLFCVTILLDVAGQTAFKMGLGRIPSAVHGAAFWRVLASNGLILGGIALYALEACTWMYVLGHAPLSVVGPMAALSYVGAVIAGATLLDEPVGPGRWWGAALVSLGSALLAVSSQ